MSLMYASWKTHGDFLYQAAQHGCNGIYQAIQYMNRESFSLQIQYYAQ